MSGVTKVGIYSVIPSRDTNSDSIRVIDDDIAVVNDINHISSILDGPSKLEAAGIGLCLQGSGSFSINLDAFDVVSGRLLLILPGQIIESHEVSEDFEGLFVAVSKNLLEEFSKENNIFSLFFQLKYIHYLDITEEEKALFIEYHQFIWRMMGNEANPYRKESIFGLLESFFYELFHVFEQHKSLVPPSAANKSRKEHILQRFFEELSKHYQTERSVSFYAGQLCLTPKHLSVVLKEVSGKTVREWVDEFVILEAKALLNSSSLSIQEISDQLHFANQSFFGKYFKHAVGISPKNYRESK